MGSFNATCIVSGLPIEAGDPVRFLVLVENMYNRPNEHLCYVHSRWQPRSVPLRAVYNDYGSIEDIRSPLAAQTLWESFKQDVVERDPVNDYDPHIRKDMSEESWLRALYEGNVYVWSECDFLREREPSDGIPSVKKIKQLLGEGYYADDIGPGVVQVRSRAAKYEQPLAGYDNALEKVRAAGYAAMLLTSRSDCYEGAASLWVATAPGRKVWPTRLGPKQKKLMVAQGLVREDVWHLLLQTPAESSRYSLALMKESAATLVDWYKQKIKSADDISFLRYCIDNEIPDRGDTFTEYVLHPPSELTGFGLLEALDIAVRQASSDDELTDFVSDMAELIYASLSYSALCGQWQPTTNGHQLGYWELQEAFHAELSRIAKVYREREDELMREDEDG